MYGANFLKSFYVQKCQSFKHLKLNASLAGHRILCLKSCFFFRNIKLLIHCLLALRSAVNSYSVVGDLFFFLGYLLHSLITPSILRYGDSTPWCVYRVLSFCNCAQSEFCGETMVVSFTCRDEDRMMR